MNVVAILTRIFFLITIALGLPLLYCEEPSTRSYAGDSDVIHHVLATTVALQRPGDGTYCAGAWIGADAIITARHCVAGVDAEVYRLYAANIPLDLTGTEMKYATRDDGTQYDALATNIDEVNDLAIVRTQGIRPEHETLRIALRPAHSGDVVHIVGHPLGIEWSYDRGIVAGYTHRVGPNDRPSTMLHVSARVTTGNSGGPAVDDYGNLVGVCSYVLRDVSGFSFYTTLDDIRTFLDAARVEYEVD